MCPERRTPFINMETIMNRNDSKTGLNARYAGLSRRNILAATQIR
jgi:hypothetical protein